jgi:hypothetical protein
MAALPLSRAEPTKLLACGMLLLLGLLQNREVPLIR